MNMTQNLSMSRALLAAMLALGGLVGTSSLSAQSVTTAPVGAVSIQVNSKADQRIGVALERPALFTGSASSVTSGTVTVTSVSGLGTEAKYLRFRSGVLSGQWFTLTSSTSTSLVVAENLQALGAATGDKVEVIPFWTLNTLFPNGAGLPASADAFDPVAFVLLNNPSASGVNLPPSAFYFYHSGATDGIDAGWLNNADAFAGAVPNTIIPPETSIIIRNNTLSAATLVTVGQVPTIPVANSVVSRVGGAQDNLIYNPYPAALTLGNSGLAKVDNSGAVKASVDFFDPTEFVLLYQNNSTLINGAPVAFYFYYAGDTETPRGWYDNATGNLADSVVIPHGAAFTVRKPASVSFTETNWIPSLPYSL